MRRLFLFREFVDHQIKESCEFFRLYRFFKCASRNGEPRFSRSSIPVGLGMERKTSTTSGSNCVPESSGGLLRGRGKNGQGAALGVIADHRARGVGNGENLDSVKANLLAFQAAGSGPVEDTC
jgi:hypothetical protein